ncbi:uncharacterized protein LOC143246753 isoform X2 [Tachypleus tridentatus]|uniref:uncharacterized protein LOC143246753 isoform X2 n=1 Tax=Tachypleus tridentatus TaxID=6853 RepID=UPI003FD14BF6
MGNYHVGENNVVYCSTAFGVNQEYQLINIQLNRPCADLIGNSTSHKIHGNNVLIVLPEDDIVHSLLQNIYGEMYQGQVVASSQSYDDSNEENPNVSKLETEINSNQPFTVSSTVNKNILKSNSCHTPLEEGLKSSETSRDVHMSSSKVEVNLPAHLQKIVVLEVVFQLNLDCSVIMEFCLLRYGKQVYKASLGTVGILCTNKLVKDEIVIFSKKCSCSLSFWPVIYRSNVDETYPNH